MPKPPVLTLAVLDAETAEEVEVHVSEEEVHVSEEEVQVSEEEVHVSEEEVHVSEEEVQVSEEDVQVSGVQVSEDEELQVVVGAATCATSVVGVTSAVEDHEELVEV